MLFLYSVYGFALCPAFIYGQSFEQDIQSTIIQINENFDSGFYDENLVLIEDLISKPQFINLDCYQKGQIFHKLGVSYYLLNDEANAVKVFQDSVMKVWNNCPEAPKSEIANTVYNIGISYQYLRDYDKARFFINKAILELEDASTYPEIELALKYHGAGNFYHEIFDYKRAEINYEYALRIYEKHKEADIDKFFLLIDMLALQISFKDYEKALSIFNQAISIYSQSPDLLGKEDLSAVYQNAGIAYFNSGQIDKAEHICNRALKLVNNNPTSTFYINLLELKAMILLEKGDFETAKEYLLTILKERKAYQNSVNKLEEISIAYENLGELHIRQGNPELATFYLKESENYLALQPKYDADGIINLKETFLLDRIHYIRLLGLNAEVQKLQFQQKKELSFLKNAFKYFQKIDTLTNDVLQSIHFEESKLSLIDFTSDNYRNAVTLALNIFELTGDDAYLRYAYSFASKTKSIILLYELNNYNSFRAAASPELVAEEQKIRHSVYSLKEKIIREGNVADSILQDYMKMQRSLDLFQSSMRTQNANSLSEGGSSISGNTLDEIRRLIPDKLAVIDFFYTSDKLIAFWISKKDFFYTSVQNTTNLQEQINQVLEKIRSYDEKIEDKTLVSLYHSLLGAGLEKMDDIEKLNIIPDGDLYKFPFDILKSRLGKFNYLLEDYIISYNYSTQFLGSEKRNTKWKTYSGFGTSYSTQLNRKLREKEILKGNWNLRQLGISNVEVEKGVQIFRGKKYLEEQATLANFYEAANDSDIIHLSLHGLVDLENPGNSCLIFDDHSDDFILSALDLYANKIETELVILSACHSADGKIFEGEGIQDISKAFLLSGAHSVLASKWGASEGSSSRIISSFLKYLKEGEPSDAALHRAKLDYLHSAEPHLQHPYFWANFALIGNGHESSNRIQKWTSPLFLILGALLLIGIFGGGLIYAFHKKL